MGEEDASTQDKEEGRRRSFVKSMKLKKKRKKVYHSIHSR